VKKKILCCVHSLHINLAICQVSLFLHDVLQEFYYVFCRDGRNRDGRNENANCEKQLNAWHIY
jgi:hypothetical protein